MTQLDTDYTPYNRASAKPGLYLLSTNSCFGLALCVVLPGGETYGIGDVYGNGPNVRFPVTSQDKLGQRIHAGRNDAPVKLWTELSGGAYIIDTRVPAYAIAMASDCCPAASIAELTGLTVGHVALCAKWRDETCPKPSL